MRLRLRQWLFPVCALLAFGAGAEKIPNLPMIDGSPIVAKVNGEPITLDRFRSELAAVHAGAQMGETRRARQDPDELMDRLINTRLILQEATMMGLGELPKFRKAIERYREQALAAILLRTALHDLELDTGAVEARFRERVKELQLASVRLEHEEDAAALVAAVEAGGDFRQVVARMEDEGKIADVELDDQPFIETSSLLPQIAEAASVTKVGALSPVVPVGDGFVVFEILAVRYPDDPEVRRSVENEVWGAQRATASTEYIDSLIERLAEVDEELLERLDYEAEEPGFSELLQDDRTLVAIEGSVPVLVSQLTQALKDKFFHGIEGAVASKRVNAAKAEVLYDMLRKRVLLAEARNLGLDQSTEYREMLEEFEDRLLFDMFVEMVVDPDVRLDDTALKSYLAEHADEYMLPAMMRIDGLGFDTEKAAENALQKLRDGADFEWMRKNGAGRIAAEEDSLKLNGELLVTSGLPDEAREAVSGAGEGEYRLCALPGGPFYVLRVGEVIPARTQSVENAASQLVPRVLSEQRTKLIEDWARQIREAAEIEIYATGDALLETLGMPQQGSK